MTKLICSSCITLLIGLLLLWPVCGQDTDDIWLNELYLWRDGGSSKLSFELVGRPKDSGADPPRQLRCTLTFYAPDDVAGQPLDPFPLNLSSSQAWGGNYFVHYHNAIFYSAAFPETGVAGAVLAYTAAGEDVEKTYCWGPGANGSSTIAGGKLCESIVRDGTFYTSATGDTRGSALYEGADGESEADFKWAASTTEEGDTPTEFSTIGTINVCGDNHCTHGDQSIKDWSFTDVTEVWLNEVDYEGGEVSIELVGRPAVSPDQLPVTVRFYLGEDAQGTEATSLTLLPDSTNFAGSYAVHTSVDGVGGAFPVGGELAGMVLTAGSSVPPVVYCWGSGSNGNTASIGGEFACGRTVRTTPFIQDGSFNSGLYNKEEEGGKEGLKEKDFTWEESKHASDAFFSTLGEVNACKEACDLEDQVLATYVMGETPDNGSVWLNELDVIGDAETPLCTLELVGRPVRVNGQDPPDYIEAVVSFYDGSAKIDDDVGVRLTPKSTEGDWGGNYVGTFKDDSATGRYSAAFPRGGKVTGVKVLYGEETRVYCWGLSAEVDHPIGGDQVKCQTVVTDSNVNANDGQTNFALWGKADGSTPPAGGTKGGDFAWLLSEYSPGSNAFDTIGAVNTCPQGQSCGDLKDQVLAEYDWTVNDVVWVNEVSVYGAVGLTAASVNIEFAARPRRGAGDPPSSIVTTLTFYDGTESMDEMSLTLSPQTSNGWKGNYVGVQHDHEIVRKAFPRGGVGGVKVLYQHEARVYCWGDDAEVGSVVGDITTKCEVVVSNEEMNVSEERRSVAMWNRDGPEYEGRGGGDFQWVRSVDDEGKDFATVGAVNVCSGCSEDNELIDQVLAEFDWKAVEVSPPDTDTSRAAGVSGGGVGVAAVCLAAMGMLGAM